MYVRGTFVLGEFGKRAGMALFGYINTDHIEVLIDGSDPDLPPSDNQRVLLTSGKIAEITDQKGINFVRSLIK